MTQTYNVGAPSRFVTCIAWLFMLLAMGAAAWAVVQSASVAALPPAPPRGGGLVGLLLAYLPWLAGSGLVVSVATLVSAVGLLMRREWARRSFIGLLVLALVVNLAGLWLQQAYMLAVVDATLQRSLLPPQVAGVFGGFVTAARALALALTLAGSAMLGWIAWRLTLPAIRQEFA